MMIMYDESYIQNAVDRDFAIYEKRFTNLAEETVFTHMHVHRDFEILYVMEGNAEMQVAGKLFFIQPHDVVLMNPYEPHYGKIVSENFHYICIDFNFALLTHPCETKILEGQLCYENVIKADDRYLRYIFECYEAVKKCEEGWKMRAKGNLLLLFSGLEGYIREVVYSKEYFFAKKTLEVLQENFSETICTKTMADLFSYNESYFCRKFKKVFHCSFSDYLRNYRVMQARKMLPYKSVSEVAVETGFSSIPYFSRIFKEITGLCPSEYKIKK